MDYEQKLGNTKYINFLPYVGPKYAQSAPKIFILGHSHYADCDGSPEQMAEWDNDLGRTREVIKDDYLATVAEGKIHRWIRCYRYMAAVLTGNDYHKSDYFWDSLAYSNFFQKHVGTSPHDRRFITNELIEDSRNAFFENLEILRPDYVIAWGTTLFNYEMPRDFIRLPDENSSAATPRIGYYKNFSDTIIWWMTHPSAPSFSYRVERNTWKAVQEKSKQYRLNRV